MSTTISPDESIEFRNSILPSKPHQKQNTGSYQEPWDTIYFEENNKSSEYVGKMCSELWDLKVRLLKRGIVFGDANQRLSDGNTTSRHTLRLCHEYDELQKRCFKTVGHPRPIWEDNHLGSVESQPPEDDPGLSDGGGSTLCDVEVESRRSFDVASRIREARKTGVPQNIGWRFSDDLEPVFRSISWHLNGKSEPIIQKKEAKEASINSTVQVLEDYLKEEDEIEIEKAALSRPTSKRLSIYPASFGAFQLELLTVVTLSHSSKRPSSIPSVRRPCAPQLRINTNVPNMTMCDAFKTGPRSGNLQTHTAGVIAPFTEFSIVDQIPLEKQTSRKKTLRKWVRQTFRRR